jgi:hypothetical protein
MVALTADVAVRLPSPRASNDRKTMGVVLYRPRRFLVGEAIDEQLYEGWGPRSVNTPILPRIWSRPSRARPSLVPAPLR